MAWLLVYLNKLEMNSWTAYQSEGGIFGRLKIVPERVFIEYLLSVINNHDENAITTNVILLSSLRRNESSNVAARCAGSGVRKKYLATETERERNEAE
ncbi:MAG TPA: hypothetical protein VMV36_03555 [Ignavibacteriaceae bacterium]|nr:hypothetical protein [Ignavibacteriaceae bacterium]